MEKTYSKIDGTTLGIEESTLTKVSLTDLRQQEEMLLNGIANAEAQILVLREKIAQAESLGIKDKVDVVEPLPTDEIITE